MSLPNPNLPVTEERLQEFYDRIKPFMGGGSGGSDYTAGDGIDITNDTISVDPMPAEDMGDVIDELPTGGNIAVTGYVPLATIIQYYGETAPDFFLACDGSTYNKADYPELAKHLLSLTNNTPYIVDGDNTKFKVPDLRGEFIRGTGTNSHTDGGNGGSVGVHQGATTIPNIGIEANASKIMFHNNATAEYIVNGDKAVKSSTKGSDITASTSWSTTTQSSFYIRPTNTSVLFCIAYKDIYSNPMNDYSTDEKVVGTWIDGKTIYQRTFVTITGNNPISPNAWTDLTNANAVPSIDNIISSEAINLGAARWSGIYDVKADNTTKKLQIYVAGTTAYVRVSHITIKYTKTTD